MAENAEKESENDESWFSQFLFCWLPYKFSMQNVGFAFPPRAGMAVGPRCASRNSLKRYILRLGELSRENWHAPCTSGKWDLY